MPPTFDHRSSEKERLDTGDYTAEEYALWLKEARLINRWLGDGRALGEALRSTEGSELSILDVGAGSGELLKIAREKLNGRTGLLVGAELSERAAQEMRSRKFGVVPVQCNALQLPFADAAFDVVMCSLVLHHLDDDEAAALLDGMGRVARRLVAVIDLDRGALAYYTYRMFAPLFLQQLTVEDGLLSILRSRRPDELRRLAERTSLQNVIVSKSFPSHVLLTAEPPRREGLS